MNFEGVRSLLLAVDLGSLTAAASRIGVPVSTVSRRVRELEDDLGYEVLARTGRGVRPAAQATDTIRRLRDVLHAVDACYAEQTPIRRLRVTTTLETALSLLPGLLPAFHADFPEVTVEVQGDHRVLALVESDFDLAFRAGRLPDASFLSRPLPSAPFLLIAAPQLADRLESVERLAATPIVEVRGPPTGLSARWHGTPFRVQPPVIARVDSFTAALPLVEAGLAYIAAPAYLVHELVRAHRVVEVQGVAFDVVPFHALYPKRHRQQAAVMAFIDAVVERLTPARGTRSE